MVLLAPECWLQLPTHVNWDIATEIHEYSYKIWFWRNQTNYSTKYVRSCIQRVQLVGAEIVACLSGGGWQHAGRNWLVGAEATERIQRRPDVAERNKEISWGPLPSDPPVSCQGLLLLGLTWKRLGQEVWKCWCKGQPQKYRKESMKGIWEQRDKWGAVSSDQNMQLGQTLVLGP